MAAAGSYPGSNDVSGERRARILAEMASGAEGVKGVTGSDLCEVSRRVTTMSGAGIMLMSGDVNLGSVCTSSHVSALIEDLQYMLGEGPCIDAYRLGQPVFEPDLAHPAVPRWLAFSPPAIAAGVRAVFGFPMTVGDVRVGALNLYADHSGELSDDQQADAVVMAGVAAEAVLAMQAERPGGDLAVALERGANFRYVVHQAAGMVSAQLDVSVPQALVRLRAYSFSHQRELTEVAADVVGRLLRFDHGDD